MPLPTTITSTCKASVQEGPHKGATCRFPAQEDGYCGRHKRNKEYDEGIAAGKRWCRFFFRGCSATLTPEDPHTSCEGCRASKAPTLEPCKHTGCRNKQKPDSKYCGKHQRDAIRETAVASGVRYCDIARGCMNVCDEGFSKCATCREKHRVSDSTKRAIRKAETEPTCVTCGKLFEPFLTTSNKKSLNCKGCISLQKRRDERRKDRVRNYGKEKHKNPTQHYESTKRRAAKRGFAFELTQEQFAELVCKPCFYCGHHVADESIGIDRFNNDEPYVFSNCKPCCKHCNAAKYIYHPRFFVQKCLTIASPTASSTTLKTEWPAYYNRSVGIQYSKYKISASRRGISFDLSEDQFHWLVQRACRYCKQEGPNGLDRIDNSRGYSMVNVHSCCNTCNLMRRGITEEAFVRIAMAVASFWSNKNLCDLDPPSGAVPVDHSKSRKKWKAAGLYLAIMSNTDFQFTSQYADTLDSDQYAAMRASVLETTKDIAIERIKLFLAALRKRRYRATKQLAANDDDNDHIIHV